MGNESEVSIRFNNEIKNQNKLKEYVEQLKTIQAFASALDKKTIADVNVAASNIKNVGAKMNTAFNLLGAREFTRAMQRLVKTMGDFVGKSSDYLENINLFQVAFDGNYKSADRFIKKMSEMYGMDESWLTRTVGIFRQLSNAMNLSAENGERLSTLMTQMSLDISSLYNIDVEKASSTLQSALAGQTKPIRGATGADITQATLQTTLSNIGIDRQVAQLSYAEKRLLIIISLTQQLNESIGDMGRTIESPANQTRVLKEQWERLSRAVGNVFLPIMAKILPYLNAILMVLTEIINMIASLFGFKLEDYDYFAGAADSVLDLEDALGGAASNAKDLKKAMMGLRGFDKLNVIRTPSAGSGGAGGGVGGTGISGDILKAFNKAYDDYQKKLENVRMKATKIRDSIMETLGFHKELNLETGEWEWKYDGIGTTIKNLWNEFLKLNPKAKAFVTLMTTLVGNKIISGITKLVTWFGGTKFGKAISSLLTPFKSLAKDLIPTAILQLNGFKSNWSNVIDGWSQSLGVFDKVKVTLVGAGGLYASTQLITSGMKDMANAGEFTAKSLAKTFGGITLDTISLASTLGSYFGANGAIAGAIVGLTVGIADAMSKYNAYMNTNLQDLEEYRNKYGYLAEDLQKSQEKLQSAYSQASGAGSYYKQLAIELDNIVDKNGKIKKGYEDRAKVITTILSKALGIEIEIVGNTIKGYDKVLEKLDELIEKKEAMLKLDALEAEATEAINKRKDAIEAESVAYKNLENSLKNFDMNDFLKKLDTAKKSQMDYYGWTLKTSGALEGLMTGQKDYTEVLKELGWTEKDLQKAIYSVKTAMGQEAASVLENRIEYQKAHNTLNGYERQIQTWQHAVGLATQGNYKELNKYFDLESQMYGMSLREQKNYLNDMLNQNDRYLEDLERNKADYDEESYKAQKKYYENQKKTTQESLDEINKTISQKSISIIDIFKNAGKNSIDGFTSAFKNLSQYINMEGKGKEISKDLQKGLNSSKPKIEIDVGANTNSFTKAFNNLIQKAKSLTSGKANGGIFVNGQWQAITNYATGGLPPVGQMFVARERGPELVGKIGSHTAVMNNDQIVSSVSNGVYNAVRSAIGNTSSSNQIFNIYLDENHKIGTYTLEQLQGMAKTNGKPIQIS